MTVFEVVKESCPARVGLMGNPSDGFHGKTLSFCLHNFAATVTITPHPGAEVLLVPHPIFDALHFTSLAALSSHSEERGYGTRTEGSGGGGIRLLQATCSRFVSKCAAAHLSPKLTASGFQMQYDTTIPRMVGLSGSSAIIVAAFRALMRFYQITLADLSITKEEFPQLILDIESVELGIAAGLQDRVVQTYGGLVHMNFEAAAVVGSDGDIVDDTSKPRAGGVYTPLSPALLPELYLVYNIDLGGDSGKVHATVKERWLRGDAEVTEGMRHLASLVDSARKSLEANDKPALAALMDENFAIRRRLYSDEVVGLKNVHVAELLNGLGLAAKFTGSGGAFVCLNRSGEGWLSKAVEEKCHTVLRGEGYTMLRVDAGPLAHHTHHHPHACKRTHEHLSK